MDLSGRCVSAWGVASGPRRSRGAAAARWWAKQRLARAGSVLFGVAPRFPHRPISTGPAEPGGRRPTRGPRQASSGGSRRRHVIVSFQGLKARSSRNRSRKRLRRRLSRPGLVSRDLPRRCGHRQAAVPRRDAACGPKGDRRWAEFRKNRRGEPGEPAGRAGRGAPGDAAAQRGASRRRVAPMRTETSPGSIAAGPGTASASAAAATGPARCGSRLFEAGSPPPIQVRGLRAAMSSSPRRAARRAVGGARAGRACQAELVAPFARRLIHQLPDSIHHRRVETGQSVGLDVKAPLLDALEQLLTLQAQLSGQLVNARRQRQLLPDLTPVSQASQDPGVFSMVRIDRWIRIRRRPDPRPCLNAVSGVGSMAADETPRARPAHAPKPAAAASAPGSLCSTASVTIRMVSP